MVALSIVNVNHTQALMCQKHATLTVRSDCTNWLCAVEIGRPTTAHKASFSREGEDIARSLLRNEHRVRCRIKSQVSRYQMRQFDCALQIAIAAEHQHTLAGRKPHIAAVVARNAARIRLFESRCGPRICRIALVSELGQLFLFTKRKIEAKQHCWLRVLFRAGPRNVARDNAANVERQTFQNVGERWPDRPAAQSMRKHAKRLVF